MKGVSIHRDEATHEWLENGERRFCHQENRCRDCDEPNLWTLAWGWYCGTDGCPRRKTVADAPSNPWPLVQVVGAIPGDDAVWAWEVVRRFAVFWDKHERGDALHPDNVEGGYDYDGDACECGGCPTCYPDGTMDGQMEGYEEPEWSGYCRPCLESHPGALCGHGVPDPCELGVPCEPFDHGPGMDLMCVWCWRGLKPFRPMDKRGGVIGCFTCKTKIWSHELPKALERHQGHRLREFNDPRT